MIPSEFVILDRLPLTANGKVDRQNLQHAIPVQPPGRRQGNSRTTLGVNGEPHTKLQELLLTSWRDVLKRQDVGCDDDFFLLGGDSLTAHDLILQIEEKLHFQLPLTILAEAPTVRKLEQRLDRGKLAAVNDTISFNKDGTQPPLFAVFGRYGHAIRLVPLLRSLSDEWPCYGLQPPGMDWGSAACSSLSEMAAHYIVRVKALQPHGPYRLLGVSFGGLVVFEMALQLERMGDTVQSLILVDTSPPNCLSDEGADFAPSLVIEDTPPRTPIEAINRRIADAHIRARSDHVLDVRLPNNVFHGDTTFLYCTGNPVVAGNDRRQLWQRLAARFRLLALPGSHDAVEQEPQFTALRAALRGLLRGEIPVAVDPHSVFGRNYRIQNSEDGECVVDQAGKVYSIVQDRIQGCLVEVAVDAETIRLKGWAVEPCQHQSAQIIAVFLDGHYFGYGGSGVLRDDAREYLPAGSTKYSGFEFHFRHGGNIDPRIRPRLFVLSGDKRAAELPVMAERQSMKDILGKVVQRSVYVEQ
jgi:thioesterase domain-containing protein/acyl carrier protein